MRQQPTEGSTTIARKSEKSAAVPVPRELYQTVDARHGQTAVPKNAGLHAERDVAFAGVVWQTTKITKYVATIQQI